MNCIIVDDEMASRSIISKLCNGESDFIVLQEFESCLEALKFLNDNEVDIIFLDLHMEVFNGFDLLKTIGTEQKVVLTTSDKDFALTSYEYGNIVDYLVKPITKERFEKAVQKARKQLLVEQLEGGIAVSTAESADHLKRSIYINIDRRLINVHFDEILYVEADGDYVNLQTISKNYHVHTTLKKINERLPAVQFMQIHRSYIINFEKIIDIQDNTVLIDKKVIPISRSNRPTLMQRLNL